MFAFSSDAGYVDEAEGALQSTNVFVSDEVSGSTELAASLEQQVGDASIGVAVFSDNAAFEASATEIVRDLAATTDYATIIVAVGDDVAAGSSVLPSGEALRIANEAEASTDSLDAALSQTIAEVVAQMPSPGAAGVDGGLIVGGALVVAAILAAGIGLVAVLRRRGRRRPIEGGLPEGVAPLVAALRGVQPAYAALAASDPVAAETARDISAISDNVGELFARLDRARDGSQHTLAAVEYEDKLRKLAVALDRDYLLDLLTHPNLWDDPAERIAEVRAAVTAVSDELVENIKQVNARRALHFQVSLDGLVGRRKELQEWDRAFGDAGGEGPRGS